MVLETKFLIFAAVIAYGAFSKWQAKKKAEAAARDSGARPTQAVRPTFPGQASGQGLPVPANTPKAQTGKDLLSQLAKELGLEIPAPAPPRPAPRPPAEIRGENSRVQTPAPSAKPKPAPGRPAKGQTVLDRHDAEAQRGEHSHSVRTVDRSGGENAPRRLPAYLTSNAPVTLAPDAPSFSELARESLMDPESIRRAFILKTILDKPLSLQPHRPG
ncbi:MAG: hypothetical protein ABI036_09495 [Fibrobacteria bacterium]